MGFFKFERLDVWKRGIEWANEVFDIAQSLPKEYQFSIGEQLRRASLSVPTNIAEGVGRDNPKEAAYFYRISKGSVYEVISLLVITGKRGFLNKETYKKLYEEANELSAMLTQLAKV